MTDFPSFGDLLDFLSGGPEHYLSHHCSGEGAGCGACLGYYGGRTCEHDCHREGRDFAGRLRQLRADEVHTSVPDDVDVLDDSEGIFALRCVDTAHKQEDPPVGRFLAGANVDAHDGRGWVTWTTDPREALVFPTPGEAVMFWGRQSQTRPLVGLGPDAVPNRPLTAYSCEVVEFEMGDES